MGFGFDIMSGFDTTFRIMGFFVLVMFVFVFTFMITILIKAGKQHKKDDSSPKLTVDAKVVTKRTHVAGHDHAHTTYYATFQVESGDRMELKVSSFDYGMLVEGDHGKLTFQGSRFLNFTRE